MSLGKEIRIEIQVRFLIVKHVLSNMYVCRKDTYNSQYGDYLWSIIYSQTERIHNFRSEGLKGKGKGIILGWCM